MFMRAFKETIKQISLGLFINGSYGFMQGDYDLANALIITFTITSMFILNQRSENGR